MENFIDQHFGFAIVLVLVAGLLFGVGAVWLANKVLDWVAERGDAWDRADSLGVSECISDRDAMAAIARHADRDLMSRNEWVRLATANGSMVSSIGEFPPWAHLATNHGLAVRGYGARGDMPARPIHATKHRAF